MAGLPKLLACYAEGRGGEWEAVCLDLDIAVQGSSLENVVNALREAIALYVESVKELPESDQERLFSRRAPLSLRLKFLWHAARDLFFRDGDGFKTRAEIMLPSAV